MDSPDFEIVDNARAGLVRNSLERLKSLAPTFREGSPQRLACVELIAEKQQELARLQMGAASRRAALALTISLLALIWPILLLAGWYYFAPSFNQTSKTVNKAPLLTPRGVAAPTPSPPQVVEPESPPEPLPPALGELPINSGAE